jgi:hypothetical protein
MTTIGNGRYAADFQAGLQKISAVLHNLAQRMHIIGPKAGHYTDRSTHFEKIGFRYE